MTSRVAPLSVSAPPAALDRGIAGRQLRWAEFLRPHAAPGFMFLIRLAMPDAPPRPALWPENRRERVEWIWQDYEAHLARAAWLDDDLVPSLNMLTGTEIFAEALGCAVHRPADNMPFAQPFIHSVADVGRVRVPALSSSTLAYLFEMADELYLRSGPAAVFRMVDIQSPMDIAALVLEKSAFYEALIEAPAAVLELADKARQLLTAFLDEWFRRYGSGFVAHYPDYYMPQGITLSEDEIGGVSADLFAKYFRPELESLAGRYGGIGLHCCAHARHQWPQLRELRGLRVLNICRPRDVAVAAYEYFSDVTAQMHGTVTDDLLETWPGGYPAKSRVVLEVSGINNRFEAEQVAVKLRKIQAAEPALVQRVEVCP